MTRNKRIAARIEEWFAVNARDLPWRKRFRGKRNPYYALVSEAMLQQTQASRVVERFEEFIERFPNIRALAGATDDAILAAWDGLGYYRRARHLRDAARMAVSEFSGRVPRDAESLRSLPGVGAYSAGAISSIAFGERVPLVDANVERVILRVEGEQLEKGSRAASDFCWDRAAALVEAATSPAALNEGLMEIGALVCTPTGATCHACPLSRLCRARRAGIVESIPSRRPAGERRVLHFGVVVVQDDVGRVLVEQRADAGLWRRMWQAPTVERSDRAVRRAETAMHVGLPPRSLRKAGCFEHITSHRRVLFDVWRTTAASGDVTSDFQPRRWLDPTAMASLAMGSAQRRAISMGAGGSRVCSAS